MIPCPHSFGLVYLLPHCLQKGIGSTVLICFVAHHTEELTLIETKRGVISRMPLCWVCAQLGLIFSSVSKSSEAMTPLANKNDVKQRVNFQLQYTVAGVCYAWLLCIMRRWVLPTVSEQIKYCICMCTVLTLTILEAADIS